MPRFTFPIALGFALFCVEANWSIDILSNVVATLSFTTENASHFSQNYRLGDMLYVIGQEGGDSFLERVDFAALTAKPVGKYDEIFYEYDGKVLAATAYKQAGVTKYEWHAYDMTSGRDRGSEIYYRLNDAGWNGLPFVYFQNDIIYLQNETTIAGGTNSGQNSLVRLNLGSGKKDHLPFWGTPITISPDRQHILFLRYDKMTLANTTTEQSTDILGRFAGQPWAIEGFLNNGLVYAQVADEICVFDLSGTRIDHFRLLDARTGSLEAISFNSDLTKAFAVYWNQSEKVRRACILDTKSFANNLDQKGLTFHPTTGVLNDSNVRIRQNPNLDAAIIGSISKGEKVFILDRTGLKIQIGPRDDFWYRIRTANGIEGWAFGVYIDFGSKGGN
jgi:hypothetical protein